MVSEREVIALLKDEILSRVAAMPAGLWLSDIGACVARASDELRRDIAAHVGEP